MIAKYLAAMTEKDSAYLHHAGAARKPARRARRGRARARRSWRSIPNIDHRYGDGRAEILGIAVLDEQGAPLAMLEPAIAHRGAHQRARQGRRAHAHRRLHAAQPAGHGFLRHQYRRAKDCALAPMRAGDIYTVDFHLDLPELYPALVFLFAGHRRRHAGRLHHVRLDRQRPGAADERAPEREIYGFLHLPCRVEVNAPPGRRRADLEQHLG